MRTKSDYATSKAAKLMKPKCQDIGMPIAERQLEGAENDKVCTVTVKLGKPFSAEADEACWYCPYSIEVGSTQQSSTAQE